MCGAEYKAEEQEVKQQGECVADHMGLRGHRKDFVLSETGKPSFEF